MRRRPPESRFLDLHLTVSVHVNEQTHSPRKMGPIPDMGSPKKFLENSGE
jgi:hypothetical protein